MPDQPSLSTYLTSAILAALCVAPLHAQPPLRSVESQAYSEQLATTALFSRAKKEDPAWIALRVNPQAGEWIVLHTHVQLRANDQTRDMVNLIELHHPWSRPANDGNFGALMSNFSSSDCDHDTSQDSIPVRVPFADLIRDINAIVADPTSVASEWISYANATGGFAHVTGLFCSPPPPNSSDRTVVCNATTTQQAGLTLYDSHSWARETIKSQVQAHSSTSDQEASNWADYLVTHFHYDILVQALLVSTEFSREPNALSAGLGGDIGTTDKIRIVITPPIKISMGVKSQHPPCDYPPRSLPVPPGASSTHLWAAFRNEYLVLDFESDVSQLTLTAWLPDDQGVYSPVPSVVGYPGPCNPYRATFATPPNLGAGVAFITDLQNNVVWPQHAIVDGPYVGGVLFATYDIP